MQADIKGISWHKSSINADTREPWMTVCLGTCTEILLAQKSSLAWSGRRLKLGLQRCQIRAVATGQCFCVLPSLHLPTSQSSQAHGIPAC